MGLDLGQVQPGGKRVSVFNPQIGQPLTGEDLRRAINKQKTGHVAKGANVRLWGAPPAVDPRTGQHYPAAIISAPYPNQGGTTASPGPGVIPGSLSTGGIIVIKVGTKEGGEFNRRVAVAGGRAIIAQLGRYPYAAVRTEKVNNGTVSPIYFSWVQHVTSGASDDLWDAPAYVDDGGGGKKFIPEGAAEVFSNTAIYMTYGIFVDGTERTIVIPATVGQRIFVPNSATYFAASTACTLYFRLAPL